MAKKKSAAKKLKKLTALQSSFVLHFVANGLQNAADAARQAGYKGSPKTLTVTATKLMKLPHVRAAVMEHLEEVKIKGADVLLELWQLASMNVGEIIDLDHRGNLKLQPGALKSHGHLIKAIRQDKDGNLNIQFHDKGRALQLLGQNLQLFQGDGVNIKIMADQGEPIDDDRLVAQAQTIALEFQQRSEVRDADS